MTTVLALETSSETASVALLRHGEILYRQSAGVATHSQTVLPMVQAVLAEAGLGVRDCDVIAFGAGPGSFTGVRTACGVAQGLAFGADLPVAPVVTLQAMALACFRTYPAASSAVALLDARMGEIYWAQYLPGAMPGTAQAPSLDNPAGVHPQGIFAVCGNGMAAYPDALAAVSSAACGFLECLPHASDVARIGLEIFRREATVAADLAQPLYLRNKVAQTVAERQGRASA